MVAQPAGQYASSPLGAQASGPTYIVLLALAAVSSSGLSKRSPAALGVEHDRVAHR
jgi:hypothetical protein